MPFCSVLDLEAFLQISVPVVKLASATRAIDEATAVIQNYCGQRIERKVLDSVRFDMEANQTKLFLPELPANPPYGGVASVTEDGDLLVQDDDWKLGAHGILHRIDAYWCEGIQIVTVVYTHGYAIIPQDVHDIATRAASRAYQAGLRAAELAGIPGIAAMTLGDYSVTFGTAEAAGEGVMGASAAPLLLKSEKAILDRYRAR